MIYKTKAYLKDREGEERVVRKFLLWPRRFGNEKLGRWMEYAWIREKVQLFHDDYEGDAWKWHEVGFYDISAGV